MLKKSDELLSVFQHHDGITATSKYHIEELFKDRMKVQTDSLLNAIMRITQINSPEICKLSIEGNSCEITMIANEMYLIVLHEGGFKS